MKTLRSTNLLRRTPLVLAGVFFFCAVFFCSVALAQGGEEALLQADRDFNKATQEKRLDGWMQFMADDVVMLHGKPVVGKEAARAALTEEWNNPAHSLTWEPKHAELFKNGKFGYTSGRWVYRDKNEKGESITLEGDYLTVWKMQADGTWKVIFDGGAADPAATDPTKK